MEKQGHVLVISHDVVGERMAGPGIRYYHLARVLGQTFETTLAVPREADSISANSAFSVAQYNRRDWASIEGLVQAARVAILPGDIAGDFPQLAHSDTYLVVDGYDPLLAEWLALNDSASQEDWEYRLFNLNRQYLIGDFFVCASERQRDWWLGLLEAQGRINPWTFEEDRTLRSLIDVVPFGLPEIPPQHARPVVKGVWKGIERQDKVLLWGGGLWPWLDPLTAIRAVARIRRDRRDVRLIFPGTRHPNPELEEIPTHTQAAIQLARELGVLGEAVFFGEWVPYDDWASVLLESGLALTLHHDALEARLAFRSRILDCVWAGLPVVATRGDATAELVARHEIGVLVDYQDVDGVVQAILQLLDIPQGAKDERFKAIRQKLTWERAAQPLMAFCRHPRRAPDRMALGDELGNPFYLKQIEDLTRENARLQTLVEGYERGRFIRFMRGVHRWRKRLGWVR